MITTIASETERTIRFLDEVFDKSPPEAVAFRLWNGTLWPDTGPRPAVLELKRPTSLHEMFSAGTEKGLAEAYLREAFEISGDTEAAIELADIVRNRASDGFLKTVANYYRLRRLPTRPESGQGWRMFGGTTCPQHSLVRDRQAVSFHYDLSNDFYRLWLDQQMVYSCAYFETADADLDSAQTAKLRHICRKLRLQPGQRLLDIGCGWGGLAIHAARHFGVKVIGVTLSEKQRELAAARIREFQLGQLANIELRDYRELPEAEPFDAVVSVGMAEHVGPDRLPEYFGKVFRLLKPGGLFLNHAISEAVRPRNNRGPSFIEEYVFPDADVPALPRVLGAAEGAGLEVRDVENLREHYWLTLRHWLRRLEANHPAALAFVNEATYRVWRLYLAGSAYAFNHCHLAIYQSLLSKPDGQGRAHVPLTRRGWCD